MANIYSDDRARNSKYNYSSVPDRIFALERSVQSIFAYYTRLTYCWSLCFAAFIARDQHCSCIRERIAICNPREYNGPIMVESRIAKVSRLRNMRQLEFIVNAGASVIPSIGELQNFLIFISLVLVICDARWLLIWIMRFALSRESHILCTQLWNTIFEHIAFRDKLDSSIS